MGGEGALLKARLCKMGEFRLSSSTTEETFVPEPGMSVNLSSLRHKLGRKAKQKLRFHLMNLVPSVHA